MKKLECHSKLRKEKFVMNKGYVNEILLSNY